MSYSLNLGFNLSTRTKSENILISRKNHNEIATDPVFSWPARKYPLNYQTLVANSWSPSISVVQNNNTFNSEWDWAPPEDSTASRFRDSLNKIFRNKCVISNIDGTECEAAHIVPRKICDIFNLNFKYHSGNGILLNRNLHTSFDNYIWTFDIFDCRIDKDTILLSTII